MIFAASMTIKGVPARFCLMTRCYENMCYCGGDCLHTGMCCYNAVQYNKEGEASGTNIQHPGLNLGPVRHNENHPMKEVKEFMRDLLIPPGLRKRQVPYYVTECVGTFAGMY